MSAMHSNCRQRGAALLLAMVILTLVATVAASMVWQQSRSVQVEAADRARTQAEWMLSGGLDFSRLILREDGRTGGRDSLDEPWATPLEEAKLSTFLALDKENTTDSGPEAYLAGRVVDAQARYNLRNLLDAEGKVAPVELKALERLCEAAGVPTDTPGRLSEALRVVWTAPGDEAADTPLPPQRVEQLVWLGIDRATVAKLEPLLTLLPVRTAINVNTASREVLLAAIDGLDLATAERLVQVRQREPFDSSDAIRKQLPPALKVEDARASFRTSFFEIYGRLRLDDRILEERSLVERKGVGGSVEVVTLRRERRNLQTTDR
jgi:general secretion pathway protein K